MSDFDLERFVTAQAGFHDQALDELRRGRKTSHWMWFVFPQIAGLGRSAMSVRYAIGSLDEARAYLAHEPLGHRLREATRAALVHAARGAEAIFGPIDAAKLKSSMTLFELAAGDPTPFAEALDAFFGGERDPATLRLLGRS